MFCYTPDGTNQGQFWPTGTTTNYTLSSILQPFEKYTDKLLILGPQMNGNNVLNGSTGSSFLYGGTGNDTFFIDDRNAPAGSSIWSTVAGFHSGDSATVWGVTPSDFTLSWVDGQGAAGYTGLTLHATAPGKPTASLTLAGLTSAALSNGALSISFGVTPNLPNLPGSNYMLIHYN